MQAIKALTQSQRVSRALAAQQVVAITFAMDAMVQRHPPQLKMPRLDVHGRPRFAKLSIHDGSKVKIAPVHSDFACGCWPLSLMGFAG